MYIYDGDSLRILIISVKKRTNNQYVGIGWWWGGVVAVIFLNAIIFMCTSPSPNSLKIQSTGVGSTFAVAVARLLPPASRADAESPSSDPPPLLRATKRAS